MVSASSNDEKYPRYPLVKRHFSMAVAFGKSVLFNGKSCIFMTANQSSRADVDRLTHIKQLLNLLCIVYISLALLQRILYFLSA